MLANGMAPAHTHTHVLKGCAAHVCRCVCGVHACIVYAQKHVVTMLADDISFVATVIKLQCCVHTV